MKSIFCLLLVSIQATVLDALCYLLVHSTPPLISHTSNYEPNGFALSHTHTKNDLSQTNVCAFGVVDMQCVRASDAMTCGQAW